MGPPGSGKGTISHKMVETFQVKHVCSSDLLKLYLNSSQDEVAPMQLAMKRGQLVSDSVMQKVVLPELKKYSHWLLDGFPRTLLQAKSLVQQEKVDVMINLNVPDQTIIERLHGRWIHAASGRIYNIAYNPPKVEGLDDETGEPLQQRDDDHPDILQQRLDTYHGLMNPVFDYFKQLGLLKTYTGTESEVLWPLIKEDITKIIAAEK